MPQKAKLPLKKAIVVIVEGETEVEFYKYLLSKMVSKDKQILDKIKIFKPINMKGISKFQRSAVTQFENKKNIKDKGNKKFNYDYYVFLCIDADVFYFEQKPPLNKEKLKNDLIESGAKQVHYIEAKMSIEDWFLNDLTGISDFLNIRKISSGYKKEVKGADKLNKIFEQAGKTYIKGCKVEGFVSKLNVEQIMLNNRSQLDPLFKALEINID